MDYIPYVVKHVHNVVQKEFDVICWVRHGDVWCQGGVAQNDEILRRALFRDGKLHARAFLRTPYFSRLS